MSADIQDLNLMISRIEYDEFTTRCGELRWIFKLPWSRTATALAKAVEGMALLVEHNHHVTGRVAHLYMVRCRITTFGADVRYENTMCRVCRHSVRCLHGVDGRPTFLWARDDIKSPIQNRGQRSLDIVGRRKLADKTQVFRSSFSVASERGSIRS